MITHMLLHRFDAIAAILKFKKPPERERAGRDRAQSRAQSFSGSLSAVGRREKLWDNGISISNLIGSSYNNT